MVIERIPLIRVTETCDPRLSYAVDLVLPLPRLPCRVRVLKNVLPNEQKPEAQNPKLKPKAKTLRNEPLSKPYGSPA